MNWVIDIDGVIGANPDFFKWWTHILNKNGHTIDILSSRNPDRRDETVAELEKWGISYRWLQMMTRHEKDWKRQAKWKIESIKRIKPDVWIDNDFKMYERIFGINLDKLIPEVKRILI